MILNVQTQENSGKSRKILVIEDQPTTALAVKKYLEFRGHLVSTASNHEESLKVAKELNPEIVISDWKLKGGDNGVQVARQLQKQYNVVVFMVTAHQIKDLEKAASDAKLKVTAFTRKPFSLSSLAEMIEEN